MGSSQNELPHSPVAVGPEEGNAAWFNEQKRLSSPGDETKAESLVVNLASHFGLRWHIELT
jgi:hypothetical protein